MRRRSNLLVLLGLASFVLGLLAVYVVTSDDDDNGGGGGGNKVAVVVAAEPLRTGELGEDVLTDERYRIEEVDASERQADAVVTPSQLSGTVLTASFAEGEQLRTSALRTIGGGTRAQIPEGFEALTLSIDYVAGGANTIVPNDRVNVFLVVPNKVQFTAVQDGVEVPVPPPYSLPRAELLLTNTLVLDVQQGTAPLQISQANESSNATAGSNSGGDLIVVVAVNTFDAEKLIFATEVGDTELYLSRVRLDDQGNPAPPVESTPGADFGTILAEEAGAAFRRSNG